jgi:hypothetical protein
MRAGHFALFALALLAACRPRTSDSGRTLEGSPADTAVIGAGDRLEADTTGLEFEAPRLIPAMRASLQVVTEQGGKVDEGTLAGYRHAAGRLVDAMLTDLNRVGVGDDGSFRALGDSAVAAIGGGAGDAPRAEPGAVLRSAGMMHRLIERYQERMRTVEG